MTFMGIDPSLTATGIAWAPDKKFQTFKPTAKDGFPRIIEIRDHCLDLATTRGGPAAGGPHTIAIEGPGFGRDGKALERFYLYASIREALYLAGRRVLVVPPATLKKFITGKGNVEKNMVLREVFRRFGAECENDNEADAVGLAMLAMVYACPDAAATQFQRDVVAALAKKIEKVGGGLI